MQRKYQWLSQQGRNKNRIKLYSYPSADFQYENQQTEINTTTEGKTECS